MSNETKRDVFEKLLSEYVADELRIDGLVYEPDQHIGELDREYFTASYADALPDDLPVVPEVVGVSIKEQKEKQSLGGTIFDAIFAVNTLGRKGVGRVVNWIVDNNEVFALAWVLGVWRVEETGEIVKLEVKD